MSLEVFEALARDQQAADTARVRDAEIAGSIRDSYFPAQRDFFVNDKAKAKGLCCPRQSGKTYGDDAELVARSLEHPGHRSLIICLTLGQAREAHWLTLQDVVRAHCQPRGYTIGEGAGQIQFHESELRVEFPNGSRIKLAGAETQEKIERLRGPQDDVVVIDEPGSFAPARLEYLLKDVAFARLISRDGELWMTGTPGLLLQGPFYKATCPSDPENVHPRTREEVAAGLPAVPTAVRWTPDTEIPLGSWSFHTWTLADNVKTRGWRRAQEIKRLMGWDDNHPTWRREYLGHWIITDEGLVYAYTTYKAAGKVTWYPDLSTAESAARHGLPEGDWRFVLGMDFGLVDATAFVVCAYSRALGEMRVVEEYKSGDMITSDVAAKIHELEGHYGTFEMMVGDSSSLGNKLYLTELQREHGIHVEPAEKAEKNAYIKLLNNDLAMGRLKINPDGELATEMEALQWDLRLNDRLTLSRRNQLKEHPGCENHLCDALLYVWRHGLHRWRVTKADAPEPGTDAWFKREDQRAAEAAVRRRGQRALGVDLPDTSGLDPYMTEHEDDAWTAAISRILHDSSTY